MKKIFNIIVIASALLVFNSCKNDAGSPGMNATDRDFGGGGTVGKGGSYARFTIAANHLYALHSNSLLVYSLQVADSPTLIRTMQLNSDRFFGAAIETIFPYKNTLLFGTTMGMLIYGIDNPSNPNFLGSITHVMACDPVVAENDTAYLTLMGGTPCRGNINQLEILDIKNLTQPRRIHTLNMTAPKGLGIDNNTLFVCDGDELKVFNVTNKLNPTLRTKFAMKNPYDVIPHDFNLILSAKDGIYQYDYSDLDNITEVSKIPVTP